MEKDSAILFFIIGFMLILWLILSLAWLLYITIKIYSIRNDLLRRMTTMLSDMICGDTNNYLMDDLSGNYPPSYDDSVGNDTI